MPREQFLAPWQRPQFPSCDGQCAIAIQATDEPCTERMPSTRKYIPLAQQVGSQGLQYKHPKNGVPSQVDTFATGEGCRSRKENLPWLHKMAFGLVGDTKPFVPVPVKSPFRSTNLVKGAMDPDKAFQSTK